MPDGKNGITWNLPDLQQVRRVLHVKEVVEILAPDPFSPVAWAPSLALEQFVASVEPQAVGGHLREGMDQQLALVVVLALAQSSAENRK